MNVLRKPLMAFLLFLAAMLPVPAWAAVVVSFYSHELGSSFPHAFITVKGTPDRGGEVVDTNFGFTAKSLTPAILMGSVGGVVETVKASYVTKSSRQFSLRISDGQYDAMMAAISRWKSLPGPSYNLNKRNCVHFVGDVAIALGLKVIYERRYIKRPHDFLQALMALNPWVRG